MGRGWGVRTLHDLPLGTFISVYSGEIFTSEQADERGKLIGDEYQADLDFFEVNISLQRNELFLSRTWFFRRTSIMIPMKKIVLLIQKPRMMMMRIKHLHQIMTQVNDNENLRKRLEWSV